METWYECHGPLKRVILHVRVSSINAEMEDICNIVNEALDSFTAFTKRDPRNMCGIRPTIWLSRNLSKIYNDIGSGPDDKICAMSVLVASQYLPYDLTIEWRDEEFVDRHSLEAPRYRYYVPEGSSYYSCGRGNGKSSMLAKEVLRIEANSIYGIPRPANCDDVFKYCEADVKATKDIWMSFHGGYTKSHTIKKVIFNNPATIVYWTDGTKTVVKRQPGDKKFDPEKGLAMAYVKHELGLKKFNKLLENAEVHDEKKR